MRSALTAAVLLGLLGAAFGAGSRDNTARAEANLLQDCGTLRWDDPRHDCVRRLQRTLQTRGAPVNDTGFYLAETTKYVTEFQTARGLPADGVADGRTLAALSDLPDDPDDWDLRRDCVSLRRPADGHDGGSRGPCVMMLRARLSRLGIAAGVGDAFDDDTTKAVTAFQAQAGLPPIGVAGPLTRRALYENRIQPIGQVQRCTPSSCVIVLRRQVTRHIAALAPDSPTARSLLADAVSAMACALVRGARGVAVVCQAVGSHILGTFADQTVKAAAQGACLQVDVGYPAGETDWFPIRIKPTQGSGCRD